LIVLGLVALCVPLFAHGNQLVERMPRAITLLSGALGLALGCLIVAKIGKTSVVHGVRGYLGVIALPVMTMLVSTYYARLGFELAEFAGFDAKASSIMMRVDSRGSGRSGGPWAYVQPPEPARQLQIKITDALYDRLDPIRQPGRDCLILPVEIGRSGYHRAILPAVFDKGIDVDRLVACDAQKP
jgi:hypothetical protein